MIGKGGIRRRLGGIRRRLRRFNKPAPVRRALSVEGMVSDAEVEGLMQLASAVPADACIVEIGSYRGRSTSALALGANGAPVYAIEPHESFEGIYGGQFGPADRRAFFENLLRVGLVEKVRLVNLSSEVVCQGWTRPVGLLWIDGDHTLEGVRRDFESWEPFLRPGGVVAFHDALDFDGGPAKLIEELCADGSYEKCAEVHRIVALRRSSD
jgi:predicted O-methyltransferase YrrM